MENHPPETLFSLLYREFPSLGEHTIRSIINFSRNNINLCYEACRKAVTAKSAPPLPHLAGCSSLAPSGGHTVMPKRSPARPHVDTAFEWEGMGESMPDWHGTSGTCPSGAGACQPDAAACYGSRITGRAPSPSPQLTNGAALSVNHGGKSPAPGSCAGDFLPEQQHHPLLGLHWHSEPDVIGSVRASAASARPSNQRMPGGYAGQPGANADSLFLRGSPPVNGYGPLKIVTGEDGDVDDSWAHVVVGDCGRPQMIPYLSPSTPHLQRYLSEVHPRGTSNGGGKTSAEFLEKILVQQRGRLEKLAQATASLENLNAELQAENTRLADEIASTKRRKQTSGFLGSSTEQELEELKVERNRLRDEVLSLQAKCDSMVPSSRSGTAQPPQGPIAGGGTPPVTGVDQSYFASPAYSVRPARFFPPPVQQQPPPYRAYSPNRGPPAASAAADPRSRMNVPMTGRDVNMPLGPAPSTAPPATSLLPARPMFTGPQQPSLPRFPPTHVPSQWPPPQQPMATHLPPQRPTKQPTVAPQRPTQPRPPHSDEGELQWGCSACTFLNHPTLSMCEMCDTPRM